MGSAARPSLKPIARTEGEASEKLDEVGYGRAAVDWGEQRVCRRFVPARVRSSVVSVLRQGRCVYRNAAGMRADPLHTGLSRFDVRGAVAKRGNSATPVPIRRGLEDGGCVGMARVEMVGAAVQFSTASFMPGRVRYAFATNMEWTVLECANLCGTAATRASH